MFWTRYKNYQEASYDGLFFVINSAESVLVQGMELDGKLRLTDSITATLGMEFVDSRYEKYTRGQCAYNRKPDNANGQCNLSGNTLPIGARLRTLTSLQWENPLYGGSVYTRWDYLYNSGANTSSEEDPRFNQPSYGLLNFNLGWRNQTWDVMLSGKNLTDEVLVDQSANANVLTPIDKAVSSPVGSYQNYIRSPRELAITLRLHY